MSPFSTLLRKFRESHNLRQKDLAEILGYEQSYVSALELGSKGPPTSEFVDRLIAALMLSEDQASEIRDALEASQRKLQIPCDASMSVYLLFHELRKQLNSLHPRQVEAMLAILRLSSLLKTPDSFGDQKSRRRSVLTGTEEAPM